MRIYTSCAEHEWKLESYGSTTGQQGWRCTKCGEAKITYPHASAASAQQDEREETEQSIAADCYFWIADRIGTKDGYSVQEHVDCIMDVLKECADYFHDFNSADEGGDNECVRLAANLRAVMVGKLEDVEDTEDNPTPTVAAIREWADGVMGAMGTEHAAKVSEEELRLAQAICAAQQVQADAGAGATAKGDIDRLLAIIDTVPGTGDVPNRVILGIAKAIDAAMSREQSGGES